MLTNPYFASGLQILWNRRPTEVRKGTKALWKSGILGIPLAQTI